MNDDAIMHISVLDKGYVELIDTLPRVEHNTMHNCTSPIDYGAALHTVFTRVMSWTAEAVASVERERVHRETQLRDELNGVEMRLERTVAYYAGANVLRRVWRALKGAVPQ